MADFTLADMECFATEAWGPRGTNAVRKWAEFNARYFDGALRPVPLVITRTMPFGRMIGYCSYIGEGSTGRTITLNVPSQYDFLLADNNTLLHEMVHQYLFERREDPAHLSDGWRREIMRLNSVITGNQIWAGRSKTVRQDRGDGVKKVVRINVANKTTGQVSMGQAQIARWPHDCYGINLGILGDNAELRVTAGIIQ